MNRFQTLKLFSRTRTGLISEIGFVSLIYFYLIIVFPLFRSNIFIQITAVTGLMLFILHPLLISDWLHSDSWKTRGIGNWRNGFIRKDNFRKSSKTVLLIVTPILLLGIFIIALLSGSLWTPGKSGVSGWLMDLLFPGADSLFINLLVKLIFYLLWGFFQQLLFLTFIQVRLADLFKASSHRKLKVVLISGIIFSLYHLPNIPLMLFTWVAGTLWACCYYETPNLFTVSISHGICGTVSSIFVFNSGLDMNVGLIHFL